MNIFISYAEQDLNLVDELIVHLSILEKEKKINIWSKKKLSPGSEIDKETLKRFHSSNIILMCISPSYLSSTELWDSEIQKTIEKHQSKEIYIIPILLKSSQYRLTYLASLQPLPYNGKAITSSFWNDYRDDAFSDICNGILDAVYHLKSNTNKPKNIQAINTNINEDSSQDYSDIDDENLLKKDISILKNNKGDIRSTIKASPFDHSNDIDGFLTKRVFFKLLHVEIDSLRELKLKLNKTVKNIVSSETIVFLNGYSGNGKTTFIHSFIKDESEFEHVYYDFYERMTNKSLENNVDSFRRFTSTAEVINLLHRRLRGDKNITKTFNFLYDNRFELKDYGAITYSCYDALEKLELEQVEFTQKLVVECMKSFHFKDSFTCFFIHLFVNTDPKKVKIVYFDNLDVISLEYITKDFLVAFEEALVNGNQISRSSLFKNSNLKFTNNFRFVFCLREANNALINNHILDRIGLKRIDFKVNFGSDFYKKIIDKRIYLIKQIYSQDELNSQGYSLDNILDAFRILTDDRYFNEVFIPLYNYDFRDAIDALLDTVIEFNIQKKSWLSYGVRGILMYGLIKKMKISNFLREYPKKYPNIQDGYCLIDRVPAVLNIF